MPLIAGPQIIPETKFSVSRQGASETTNFKSSLLGLMPLKIHKYIGRHDYCSSKIEQRTSKRACRELRFLQKNGNYIRPLPVHKLFIVGLGISEVL